MNLRERIFLLSIHRLFYSYPHLGKRLIELAGSAEAVFRGRRSRWRELFGERRRRFFERFEVYDGYDEARREMEECNRKNIEIITLYDIAYPKLLKEIYDPPLVLYSKGAKREILGGPCVAIVGARKSQQVSKGVATEIAGTLSDAGFIIVSGMAYGADAAAHMGAIGAEGMTAAVLGSGVDIIYPAAHRKLAERIGESGLIVSEFPLGTGPMKHHFPQRNRIISGLSVATIVVEATERSGSLITAQFALDQDREVLAVPQTAGLATSVGTNNLLREGAMFVEKGEDAVALLSKHLPQRVISKKSGHLECDMGKDSALLSKIPLRGAVTVDELVSETGCSASEIISELARLTIEGSVTEIAGRRFKRTGG